jgi:uncharacterized membrane protein YdbT with pleckstrin-like domain
MLIFFRTLVYRIYYAIIIAMRSHRSQSEWKKAQYFAEHSRLNSLARHFKRAIALDEEIIILKLKQSLLQRRTHDNEALSQHPTGVEPKDSRRGK